MGGTEAFCQLGATNPDDSKMLSSTNTTVNTTTAAHPKLNITIQELLQDQSLLHWHQPIDEALDLHLHGLLAITNKTLAPDSWTKWPKKYCRAMLQLVELVSPTQANELLTAKLANTGLRDRNIGTQPGVIREVVDDVKKRLGLAVAPVAVKKKKTPLHSTDKVHRDVHILKGPRGGPREGKN